MLQFELENPFDFNEAMREMWKIVKRNLQFSLRHPLKQKAWEELVRVMIGANKENYEWKIGDMDSALGGNLPKITN